MSLPLFRPLLLVVGATSLVFFGGVIALTIQSSEPTSALSAPTLSVPNLVTQNADITSDLSPFNTVANPLPQSSLATLSSAQATVLAKQNVPSALLQATPELINYNGTVAYEVRLDSATSYIDANLGTVLNPVATDDYRADSFDDDDYDDDDYKDKDGDNDKYKSKRHSKKKHHDEDHKDNGRLIATGYQQHDEDGYDD